MSAGVAGYPAAGDTIIKRTQQNVAINSFAEQVNNVE